MNLIVMDDFYRDPEAVRDLALRAQYRDVRQLNYPGYQSARSYSSPLVQAKIQDAIGRPLAVDSVSRTFGKFRMMLKESTSRLRVHLDGVSHWTGVLYLNRPEQCLGGTAFFATRRPAWKGPCRESG